MWIETQDKRWHLFGDDGAERAFVECAMMPGNFTVRVGETERVLHRSTIEAAKAVAEEMLTAV